MDIVSDEQRLEERRRKRMAAKQRIQALYMSVSENFREKGEEWQQMAEELEAYAAPAVWAILKRSPFATRDSFETIAGAAREALYGERVFDGYRRMMVRTPGLMFSDYCRGIYRHKAMDFVEKMKLRTQQEMNIDDAPPVIVSGEENMIAALELSEAENFLKYYVDAVMNSDANPFQIMLLCYSKILPVALHLTNCDSADTWAWEHMQGRTMQELSEEFVQVFNSTMRAIRVEWGAAHWQALAQPYVDDRGRQMLVADVVLTEAFTQSNTKNWVARTNVRIRKHIVERILREKDEDMIRLAMRYTRSRFSV